MKVVDGLVGFGLFVIALGLLLFAAVLWTSETHAQSVPFTAYCYHNITVLVAGDSGRGTAMAVVPQVWCK